MAGATEGETAKAEQPALQVIVLVSLTRPILSYCELSSGEREDTWSCSCLTS
jgi:hypothetical protein